MPLLLIGMSTLLFVPGLHHRVVMRQPLRSGGAGIGMASEEATPSPLSMDVSDLGVTMDDLKAPISDVMDVEASGCESTSRISPDSGCVWSETASRMEVRSAPAAAIPCIQAVTLCLACNHTCSGDADHPGAARPARRLARGRDDRDHCYHHRLRQGGLVVRARLGRDQGPIGPATAAQAADWPRLADG